MGDVMDEEELRARLEREKEKRVLENLRRMR